MPYQFQPKQPHSSILGTLQLGQLTAEERDIIARLDARKAATNRGRKPVPVDLNDPIPNNRAITLSRHGNGFIASFKYDPYLNAVIKRCLGFTWDKVRKYWWSEGPEVLLDLDRLKVPRVFDAGGYELQLEFYRRLEAIIATKTRQNPEGEQWAYQRQGSELLVLQQQGINTDEMGLGKSKQALDAAALTDARKILILCLKTNLYNWNNELKKWHPDWRVLPLPEDKEGRELWWSIVGSEVVPSKPTVFIANYESLHSDRWPLTKHWDVFIFDEATQRGIKNRKTATWTAMRQIASRAHYVWPLTGTPLETKVDDLYAIMSIARPSVFGEAWTRFKDDHLEEDQYTGKLKAKNLDLLRERIAPWIIRRTKEEVQSELPPKLPPLKLGVELDEQEREWYHQLALGYDKWDATERKLKDRGGMESITQMLRFQQLTSSPALLDIQDHRGSKFWELAKLLEPWEGRAVIFTRFEQMAFKLHEWMGLHPRAIITGTLTSAQERFERTEAFNRGELGKVFIGTDALAYGANITGADLVVHYDKLWNPAKERQREDRLHRYGQDKPVNVVYLLADATIDVAMDIVTQEREILANAVVDGADEVFMRVFTAADYRGFIEGKVNR